MKEENNEQKMDEILALLKKSRTNRIYGRIRDTVFAFLLGITGTISIINKPEKPEVDFDSRIPTAIQQIREIQYKEDNKIDSLEKLLYKIKAELPSNTTFNKK